MQNSKQKHAGISANALIDGIIQQQFASDVIVSDLVSDSRDVTEGALFVALQGDFADGHLFVNDAIARGAVAILAQRPVDVSANNVSVIVEPELREKLGFIADRFFNHPSRDLTLVGVTGTNGKTSITHFITHALTEVGLKAGMIGTLGAGFVGKFVPGKFTTPEAIQVHALLADFRDQGAKAAAMEVSSHGLDQSRVGGVQYDIAIFTNLTHDHLDYHHDMESYWQAKRKLFFFPGLKHAIINIDDPHGEILAIELTQAKTVAVYTISLKQKSVPGALSILASEVAQSTKGVRAKVTTPWGEGILNSCLLGAFNVSNLLAALVTLLILKISLDEALPIIARLDTVPGRMQCVRSAKRPLVVVDYAHTPDALEQALIALRAHTQGQLWCVFGCGGGRDREKRAVMGQIAERYSDQLIITNDNPRDDDPEAIVQDILQGLLCSWAAEIELDRGAAIAHAVNCAGPNDIVLIAGKGHEQYQQVGAERIPFNDVEQVKTHFNL